MATTYQIIYWRDIPAQVKVRSGRDRLSRPLADRFSEAIDQAAMVSGMQGSDDYLNEWRKSDWEERAGEPEAVAEALVAELETAYPPDLVKKLVKNGGYR